MAQLAFSQLHRLFLKGEQHNDTACCKAAITHHTAHAAQQPRQRHSSYSTACFTAPLTFLIPQHSMANLPVHGSITEACSCCSFQLGTTQQSPRAEEQVLHLTTATASQPCTLLTLSSADVAQLGAALTADVQQYAQGRRAWRAHRIAACRTAAQVCLHNEHV